MLSCRPVLLSIPDPLVIPSSSSIKTGIVYDTRFLLHEGHVNHPERPARVRSIMESLTHSV